MNLSRRAVGPLLLIVFAFSGLAGLIYQSVWSHYLGLTLGHAAYAQTLVLAIFMGGMALGAWIASLLSSKWRNLIVFYAAAEVIIGVFGLVFHPLFQAYVEFSQGSVFPGLNAEWAAHAWQWGTAALLIAPQTVLLGMTFPLISAAYLRATEACDGEVLGGLYFANSIGAAIGALLTTFLLLPVVGMPGSMLSAGLINIVVGLCAYLISKFRLGDDEYTMVSNAAVPGGVTQTRLVPWVLAAAFATGATSFVYEIGWVRLLNQALGTTLHAFELMLAAFISGLAFGGLWVRSRGSRIVDAIRAAGWAQILMGIAAVISLPVFAQSFGWVGWLLESLARSDSGYTLYTFSSAVIALLVMFPAAFFAGMTLPLFTVALLQRNQGESAIGRVYAANTLGAIVGVFLMVHLLVPRIGVANSVVLAALVDACIGVGLLLWVANRRLPREAAVGAIATIVAIAVCLPLARIDPRTQVSGVFRTGRASLGEGAVVRFLKDGKTATTSVVEFPSAGFASIATNGKPDAALALDLTGEWISDEATMMMAASLPLLLHPDPRDVAIIGWGSGLTTHTLLGSGVPRIVDSIEIERTMYEAARHFGSRVDRAYSDPRSKIHFDDARTYFATGNRRYDVIVSEPSNPWVSGVASLFTREFYGFLRAHLNSRGILVQWVQSYELDDALMATMLAALLESFPNTEVYLTNTSDLLFVAQRDPGVATPDWSRLQQEPLRAELARLGLDQPSEYKLRRIGGPQTLRAFIRMSGARPHSDYFPTVSLGAPRARFVNAVSETLQGLVDNGVPMLDVLEGRMPPGTAETIRISAQSRFSAGHQAAAAIRRSIVSGTTDPGLVERSPELATALEQMLRVPAPQSSDAEMRRWSSAVSAIAMRTIGILPAADLSELWIEPVWLDSSKSRAETETILAALKAAAQRSPVLMSERAREALALPPGVMAQELREMLLIVGMTGDAASGHVGNLRDLDASVGRNLPASKRLGPARSFLLAWPE